jgi:phosphate starvation-inducible PhoH-like protein
LTQISAAERSNTSLLEGAGVPPAPGRAVTLQFGNNALLSQLLGDHDRHLIRLEQALGIRLACRGNRIAITGDAAGIETAQATLNGLYDRLERGHRLSASDVDAAIKLNMRGAEPRLPRPAIWKCWPGTRWSLA